MENIFESFKNVFVRFMLCFGLVCRFFGEGLLFIFCGLGIFLKVLFIFCFSGGEGLVNFWLD